MNQKNKKHLTMLITVFFFLSSLAFMASVKAQSNVNTWTITVLDSNNQPLSGVFVTLYQTVTRAAVYSPSLASDVNGVIFFTAPIPPNDLGFTEVSLFGVQGPTANPMEIANVNLQGVSETINVVYGPPFGGGGLYTSPPTTPTPFYNFPTATPTPYGSTSILVIVGLVFAIAIFIIVVLATSKPKARKNTKH